MTELEMMKNILDSIPYRIVFVDMDHIIADYVVHVDKDNPVRDAVEDVFHHFTVGHVDSSLPKV